MGVSCDFEGCSVDELGSVQQLEMHAAFKHVPFDELVFVCSRCPHKPQFGTPTQLLKHKAATHQGAAPVSNDIPVRVLGLSAASNQEPAPRAHQPASGTKTKRFQCNRCAYGTNHSAWLLQKHVIYEHLVDQLGHAHEHDPGLSVPKVAKPTENSAIKCEMSSEQREEPYYEQPGGFYDGAMEQTYHTGVFHGDVAADAAQLCDSGQNAMTQQLLHSAEDAGYGEHDGGQASTRQGISGPKPKIREDYGEAVECLSIRGKHPLYKYNSKTHPGHIYEFALNSTTRNGLKYARCMQCSSLRKGKSQFPIVCIENGRFSGIDPDFPKKPHVCTSQPFDAVAFAIKQKKRKAAAAMLEWGSILQPKEVVQRFREELLADPELTDEQRQAAVESFRLNKMRSVLGRRRAIALRRSAHCAKATPAPGQQPQSSRAGAGLAAAAAGSSATPAARCALGNQ